MKLKTVLFVSLVCCSGLAPAQAQKMTAEERVKITEPVGGQPAPVAKPSVADLDNQVIYQRAFEAVIWSLPAVSIYGFHRAAKDIGAKDNTILAWSLPAKPNAELLTANNQAPYTLSQTDLRRGAGSR